MTADSLSFKGGIHDLGLSVSKALIDAHGGDISVQSRVGQGTTVLINIPYDPKLARPAPFNEERRFRRIQLRLPVKIFFSRGQATLNTELSTLSSGGCYSRLIDPQAQILPELGDQVSLKIHYFGQEVLEIPRGRVANVSWAGIHSGIGIEFTELDTRARKVIEAIVKSHST